MSCSKLFSGDLPEISNDIIQNLRNNVNTLYSLALVNRFWCRLAIPLLWEDPFSVKCKRHLTFHFLDIYLLFLNDNDKNEAKGFYKFDSNSRKPLFNYPSLIKTLNLFRMRLHIVNWLNSSCNVISTSSTGLVQLSSNRKRYVPLTLINHLKIELNEQCQLYTINISSARMKFIHIFLFKLFIENNVSLSNLHIYVGASPFQPFYEICDMILNNPKFISDIEIFSFEHRRSSYTNTGFELIQIQTFLSSLPSLFTSIKHINISTDFEMEFESLGKLAQSQSQLSSIKASRIGGPFGFGSPLLDSLSNNLTSLSFFSCHFSNIMESDAFSYLTQLESLQFNYCNMMGSKVFQPFLNIITPLKIKTLMIYDCLINEFTPVQSFIQKIGFYIENLILGIYIAEIREKLFDTIINCCGRIKFLHLNHIDRINVPQLSKMIFNFDNYLKYLTLEVQFTSENDDSRVDSIVLNELSKILPLSLYYLDLNLVINPSDLQVFFENCKQVELKKLLIRNKNWDDVDTTLKVIKNFVKEKNLDFLTYGIGSSLSAKEEIRHKSLEKLVDETQSFVKMMKYDDLVVKVSDIDGNLDC